MGKPLISNATMLGMYKTMQHLRTVKRTPECAANLSRAERSRLKAQHESLYAAVLSQMHRRDTLWIEGKDSLLDAAADAVWPVGKKSALYNVSGTSQECAGIAAGVALQQSLARNRVVPRPVVLALLRDFPVMPGVLECIQDYSFSALLIVQGEPQSRVEAQRYALSTKVPVMPVDAADAVALCRVLQECMLRARNGWGGAVIHALRLPDADDPLVLLEAHLRKRGLEPPLP